MRHAEIRSGIVYLSLTVHDARREQVGPIGRLCPYAARFPVEAGETPETSPR